MGWDERNWHNQRDSCQPEVHAERVIEARRFSGQSWRANRVLSEGPVEGHLGIPRIMLS